MVDITTKRYICNLCESFITEIEFMEGKPLQEIDFPLFHYVDDDEIEHRVAVCKKCKYVFDELSKLRRKKI